MCVRACVRACVCLSCGILYNIMSMSLLLNGEAYIRTSIYSYRMHNSINITVQCRYVIIISSLAGYSVPLYGLNDIIAHLDTILR